MGIQINGQTDTVTATDGSINVGGDVTIPGVLTYEDVTNVDSVGVITARNGLHVTSGSVGIGTVNPESTSQLHIKNTSGNAKITLETSESHDAYINFSGATAEASIGYEPTNNAVIISNSADGLTSNERFRITSGGNVGIGTDNPSSHAQLNVVGSSYWPILVKTTATNGGGVAIKNKDDVTSLYVGSGGSSWLTGSAITDGLIRAQNNLQFATNGNNERLRITNAGDLFVAGTGGMNTTQLPNGSTINVNGTSSNDGLSVIRYSTGYGAYGLNIGRSKSNTLGTNAAVTNGNDLGHITFYGADGTDFNQAAMITAQVDGDPSDGTDMPGRLVFKTSANASATPTERFRIGSDGKVGIPSPAESSALLGINGASTSELTDSSPLYNQGNPCYLQIKNTTDDISDPECGIILQPRNSSNGSVAIFAKRTGSFTSDLVYRVRTDSSTSAERLRIKNDGGVGIGIANPESKVHIRNSASIGKDTYATANTGGSQTPPPGTFRWDNNTPVAGNGRGYKAWVQSGDAYPNASNYIDVLIRNAGFYRITLKRSHSSADAAVCQMMIYGLANSGNSNYPVVHMNGAMGSGTSTATVQSGNGRGSSNAVASFYWEIHSYNINTHDTIIRITTTGSNNQGIVALIEQI